MTARTAGVSDANADPRLASPSARLSAKQEAARGQRGVLSSLRQSIWCKPLVRVALVLAGLVVLGAIGHAVGAGRHLAPNAHAEIVAAPPATNEPSPAAVPIAAPPPTPCAPAPAAAARGGRATPEDPVILNTATVDDLRRIPGVGAKRAEAILALRTRLGRFRQVEDLMRVRGIGRAMIKRLRPLVRLDPPTPPPP